MALQLSINRVARNREARDNSAEPTFAAESEKIVNQPADIQTNKNYGGDINPNA